MVLTLDAKQDLLKHLLHIEVHCQAEVDELLIAWKTRLEKTTLSPAEITGLYRHFTMPDDDVLRVKRRVTRESYGRLAKELIQKIDSQEAKADGQSLSFMIGELTAGEEHLRDPVLGLRLAQRQLDLRPEHDMANKDLAWALFANGRYQECLDTFGDDRRIGDPMVGAIVAMSLWHLGQKEKADEYLNEQYEKELAQYVEKRKKDAAKDMIVWPTAANLLRLDGEAKKNW
jgi:hypothetical protein